MKASPPHEPQSDANLHDVWMVMLFAGLCGLYFGLTTTWQIAVESAQVLAGIVKYPSDNPFYMYHVKSWTLLHQIPALLLTAGISERVVSHLLGCTAAVLSFESLALCALTFSRNRFVACGVPLICLATNCFHDCGAVYPIRMLANVYWTTYGVTGTYYVLLVWSLWGVGLLRPAAFLCGLAPAVHPALGAWCIATVVGALAWDRVQSPKSKIQSRRRHFVNFGLWTLDFGLFATGLLLTAISFAAQRWLARELSATDPVLARQMLEAFVDGWDNHRFPVPLEHIQWQIGWCTLALATISLAWHGQAMSQSTLFLLRIVIVTTLAGLAMCWLTWCTHWLPLAVVMAMPGRFLNFAVVLAPALLAGLAWRWRSMWSVAALYAGLMLFCVLRTVTVRMELFYVPAAAKVFVACGLILLYLQAQGESSGRGRLQYWLRSASLVSLALLAFLWRREWHLAGLLCLAVIVLYLLRNRLKRPLARGWEPLLVGVAISCPLIAAGIQAGPWLALGLAAGVLCLESKVQSPRSKVERASSTLDFGHWTLDSHVVVLVLGAACLALVGSQVARQLEARSKRFSDWRNDPLFAAAGKSDGLLLTAPRLGIVQLRSRRGVVLNGEAMNQLTYVPASGPAMNRMLNEIYGDDLLTPRPAGWMKAGGLMQHSAYDLWQNRPPEEWRRLAREFGFRHIVTYRDWKLQLPIAASSGDYLLYHVPEQAASNAIYLSSSKPETTLATSSRSDGE